MLSGSTPKAGNCDSTHALLVPIARILTKKLETSFFAPLQQFIPTDTLDIEWADTAIPGANAQDSADACAYSIKQIQKQVSKNLQLATSLMRSRVFKASLPYMRGNSVEGASSRPHLPSITIAVGYVDKILARIVTERFDCYSVQTLRGYLDIRKCHSLRLMRRYPVDRHLV